MTRQQRLRRFLESMGRTSDEVAAFLRKHKIRGTRGNALSCPVARVLTHKFRGLRARVSRDTSGDLGGVQVTTPPPVAAFIWRFDEGMYPDLDLEQ